MNIKCIDCVDGEERPLKEIWCKRYAILKSAIQAKYHGCYMGKETEQ